MYWCADSKGTVSSRGKRCRQFLVSEPRLGGRYDQRALGGISADTPVPLFLIEGAVVAERSGAQEFDQAGSERLAGRLVLVDVGHRNVGGVDDRAFRGIATARDRVDAASGGDALHGHLVLGQRAGLV